MSLLCAASSDGASRGLAHRAAGLLRRTRLVPEGGRAEVSEVSGTPRRAGASLADKYPELAAEWHPARNGELTPKDLSPASGKQVWWLCRVCGHQWIARVGNRSKGTGCRLCAWKNAREKLRKPAPGGSLADERPDLAKEWHQTKNRDLTPWEVKPASNIKVWWKCGECGHEWVAVVKERSRGRACPICSAARAAKARRTPRPGASLADIAPELATQWHSSHNGALSPGDVSPASSRKVWWQCASCGAEWLALVANRVRGSGCPQCAIRRRRSN